MTGICLQRRNEGKTITMYYLLLLLHPMVSCCQNVAQKQYNLRQKQPNVLLFSALTSLIALIFFLIISRFQLNFDARLIPYALGFGICYASAWVGSIFALRYGSMAISSLIVSCSLAFPVGYGLIMGEAATPVVIVGMALLLGAMVLVNCRFGQKEKFSLKWFMCVMVAFVGNGFCSIFQNMLKRTLGDGFSDEFMIVALAVAVAGLMTAACLTSKNVRADFKGCLPYASANGVANGMLNLLTLTLIGNIPNTVLYPSMSALGMVFTFLLSFIVYRERFGGYQYVGYALGVASVILLNL